MSAIEILLRRLIDYAGLYPPASLEMDTAVGNYLTYLHGEHAAVLGRFIVDVSRLDELSEVAGKELPHIPLSVIVPANADWGLVAQQMDERVGIVAVEVNTTEPSLIERIRKEIPSGVEAYFEIQSSLPSAAVLDAVVSAKSMAKLRAGGVTAEAFPSPTSVAVLLESLAVRKVPFKATAGLHHPIRSRHPLTYAADSPSATMHGFMNLLCAAAIAYFGSSTEEAQSALEEDDPGNVRLDEDGLDWRSYHWSGNQLRKMRKEFFLSFGACSFAEPIQDLEALGWL